MNQKRKIVKTKNSSNLKIASSSKPVKLIKNSKLRSFRLIEHKHTGKIIHHKHTSHLALVLILVFLGVFMYITHGVISALPGNQSGSVSVSLLVPGPPPTSGAVIISPKDGALIDEKYVDISGSCQPKTFVVVYSNGQAVGNSICSLEGQFMVNITLVRGSNEISVKNFDNLNQAGPSTASIVVYYSEKIQSVAIVPLVVLPNNPVLLPGISSGVNFCSDRVSSDGKNVILSSVVAICSKSSEPKTCDDYTNATENLPVGGDLSASVVCTPRYGDQNKNIAVGILVWGGQSPYALNISWGDIEKDSLISVSKPGYVVVRGSYGRSGSFDVGVLVSDKDNKSARTGTTLEVGGDKNPDSLVQYISKGISSSWFETPVPLYMTALVVTLGFWGGDIFDRYLGASKPSSRKVRHS